MLWSKLFERERERERKSMHVNIHVYLFSESRSGHILDLNSHLSEMFKLIKSFALHYH